jgi:hypothetical protein
LQNAVQRYHFLFSLPNIFCTFAHMWLAGIKKYRPYLGLVLIYIGVLVLFICHFIDIKQRNLSLLTGFFFICAGIVVHIVLEKKRSKY